MSKLTVPTLLSKFKFDFTDGVSREDAKYLWNNMVATRAPEFSAKVSRRNLVYTVQ